MSKFDFKTGDLVKFRLAKKEVEGRVLESLDKEVVLIKLSSGYNVGINKENILDYEIVENYKDKKVIGDKVTLDGKKRTIGLVVTGGTLASKLDPKTGGVRPLTDINEFRKFYPKLFEEYNVEIKVPFMKDSSAMDFNDWKNIAEEVYSFLNDKKIEGVIVTHGTDTLHYTSAALSFFLKDLNKPVVLTYSQRSIDRASSDAEINLICAAKTAVSDLAEVVIVGHASTNDDYCNIMRGTKVRKMHASKRDAFKPINSKEIGRVWSDKIEINEKLKSRNSGKPQLDISFNDKIALVKFYPGQDVGILDYYKGLGVKGIVLEVLGLGQIGGSESKKNWNIKLKKLIKDGFFVCAVSQTINGRLNPNVYSAGRELEDTGVLFLGDMLSETAFVKLGWILGHKNWNVHNKMLENFSGEFTDLLTD